MRGAKRVIVLALWAVSILILPGSIAARAGRSGRPHRGGLSHRGGRERRNAAPRQANAASATHQPGQAAPVQVEHTFDGTNEAFLIFLQLEQRSLELANSCMSLRQSHPQQFSLKFLLNALEDRLLSDCVDAIERHGLHYNHSDCDYRNTFGLTVNLFGAILDAMQNVRADEMSSLSKLQCHMSQVDWVKVAASLFRGLKRFPKSHWSEMALYQLNFLRNSTVFNGCFKSYSHFIADRSPHHPEHLDAVLQATRHLKPANHRNQQCALQLLIDLVEEYMRQDQSSDSPAVFRTWIHVLFEIMSCHKPSDTDFDIMIDAIKRVFRSLGKIDDQHKMGGVLLQFNVRDVQILAKLMTHVQEEWKLLTQSLGRSCQETQHLESQMQQILCFVRLFTSSLLYSDSKREEFSQTVRVLFQWNASVSALFLEPRDCFPKQLWAQVKHLPRLEDIMGFITPLTKLSMPVEACSDISILLAFVAADCRAPKSSHGLIGDFIFGLMAISLASVSKERAAATLFNVVSFFGFQTLEHLRRLHHRHNKPGFMESISLAATKYADTFLPTSGVTEWVHWHMHMPHNETSDTHPEDKQSANTSRDWLDPWMNLARQLKSKNASRTSWADLGSLFEIADSDGSDDEVDDIADRWAIDNAVAQTFEDDSQTDDRDVADHDDQTISLARTGKLELEPTLPVEDAGMVGCDSWERRDSVRTEMKPGVDELQSVWMTASVVKWLKKAEAVHNELFWKRMKQLVLGVGHRKRLVGCEHFILETYLDQATAQRVLWTDVIEAGAKYILVWFVSKHDQVPRKMKLIDKELGRHADRKHAESLADSSIKTTSCPIDTQDELEIHSTQPTSALRLDHDSILLDPVRHLPLRIHEVAREDIPSRSSSDFVPPLRMNKQERVAVEREGSVLLLGRSGTGKTVCICNSMSHHRHQHTLKADAPPLRQLFVARSKRICQMVRHLQRATGESMAGVEFLQLDNLISSCLAAAGSTRTFARSQCVDFEQFKAEIYDRKKYKLDPLIVWTQIRSFIKGSIEAALSGKPLTEAEYLGLGARRVRLDADERKCAYRAFEGYAAASAEHRTWDETDQVLHLFASLAQTHTGIQVGCVPGMRYDKGYCDEVQDLTQAEVGLLVLLCGPHSLFLAGDPAQSVEEGVDFRFDEIRSAVYKLAPDERSLEKPVKLTANFRSHSGILSLAGAVLEVLVDTFSSTTKLPVDNVHWRGPLPGLAGGILMADLCKLLEHNQQLVLLVPDEKAASIRQELQEWGGQQSRNCSVNSLVLGIREAKGLEFPTVAVLDFFSSLPDDHQKPWRELVRRGAKDPSFGKTNLELEKDLKQLYTAATRAQEQLLFVERTRSVAGEAAFRWLREKALASDEATLEASLGRPRIILTREQWAERGVSLAMHAEDAEAAAAVSLVERAQECFQHAAGLEQGVRLQRRAALQLKALHLRMTLQERRGTTLGSVGRTGGSASARDNSGRPASVGSMIGGVQKVQKDHQDKIGKLEKELKELEKFKKELVASSEKGKTKHAASMKRGIEEVEAEAKAAGLDSDVVAEAKRTTLGKKCWGDSEKELKQGQDEAAKLMKQVLDQAAKMRKSIADLEGKRANLKKLVADLEAENAKEETRADEEVRRVAGVCVECVREGLMEEAREVCEAFAALLPSAHREQLQHEVLRFFEI